VLYLDGVGDLKSPSGAFPGDYDESCPTESFEESHHGLGYFVRGRERPREGVVDPLVRDQLIRAFLKIQKNIFLKDILQNQ
jgi:hypothetical protein